jgi:hypothetical protein
MPQQEVVESHVQRGAAGCEGPRIGDFVED